MTLLTAVTLAACGSSTPARDGASAADAPAATDAAAPAETSPVADGGGDSVEEICARIGLRGECVGQTLRFCAFGELKERQCDVELAAMGLLGQCELLSEAWGHDCTLDIGQPCQDSQGNSAVCHGATSGCIWGTDALPTCRADVGSCDPDAALPSHCLGQLLLDFCEVSGQLFGTDCAALGGSCDEGQAACVGLPAGTACNATTRRCADTLSCQEGQCAAP